MLHENVEHVPVLDDERRVIGICTRTDVLSARRSHFALDRRQPGWLSAVVPEDR
jgi:CBS-domain-containing membrane protein